MAENVGRVAYISTSNTLNVTAIVIVVVFLALTVFVVVILMLVMRQRRKKSGSIDGGTMTTEQAVAYARSISMNGSQYSGSQMSGEARVVPPMSPLRNSESSASILFLLHDCLNETCQKLFACIIISCMTHSSPCMSVVPHSIRASNSPWSCRRLPEN